MTYNTKEKSLMVPEYGRHIQNMVDHCLTIKDKKKRQACAEEIVKIMACLFPDESQKKGPGTLHWNRLAQISNYELDVDYPVDILPEEELYRKPDSVAYPEKDIIYLHYGHIIQELIDYAGSLPEGKEKQDLAILIANRMKFSYTTWNRDFVTDDIIFKDLFELSNGRLVLNSSMCTLDHYVSNPSLNSFGKKKK